MALTQRPFEKIVDMLAKLKDTSELMIDLAYSSLLLNNKELAEEVEKLEEYVDNLHTDFERFVLSSGFKPEEASNYLGLMRLGVVIERIADAAAQMAEIVLRGIEPHAVLKLAIEDAEETVARIKISMDSKLIGKTLRQAEIPEETGMWILVVRRGNKWIRPRPDIVLEAGDIVIASGYAEGEADLRRLASENNSHLK